MIRFLRSFLCCISFAIFGIGGLIVGMIVFPMILLLFRGDRQRRYLAGTVRATWRGFISMLCALRLISVRCPDSDKLRTLHGHIIIANHPSLLDVVILVSFIPNSICIVKDRLLHNFFIGRIIRRIYLSNGLSPAEFLSRGTEYLNAGYNIIIFPEGTRTVPGRAIHFHRGFAYLQIASRHPITPIKITNAPRILGKDQPWHDIGRHTSVYTLTLLPVMGYDPSLVGDRTSAILITRKAKTALFSA